MKTLVVYTSKHKGNTKKIAEAISDELSADLLDTSAVTPEKIRAYDMVGIGSGIYGGQHDKEQFELVKKIDGSGKLAFIFATSGGGKEKSNKHMKKALEEQGFKVVGTFITRGFCSWGPFKLFVGGLSKGHPNESDVKAAKEFAKSLK